MGFIHRDTLKVPSVTLHNANNHVAALMRIKGLSPESLHVLTDVTSKE